MKPKKISLALKNISFKYNETDEINALENINLDFYEGEYVVIIGHNGSGKSTLSKIIKGIESPNKGEIFIYDEKLNQNNKNLLRIVFQNPQTQFIGSTPRDDIA